MRTCAVNLGTGLTYERPCHQPPERSTRGNTSETHVWLRERPRVRRAGVKLLKAKLSLAPAGATRARAHMHAAGAPEAGVVDVTDEVTGVCTPRVRLQLNVNAQPPPGVTPCAVCGDMRGPLGLCLCREQYVV